MSDSVKSLIAYCRENNRVCPQPQLWNQLWGILPDRKQIGAGWQPATPLILAAWHDTPAIAKMLRLVEHIEWAEKHNSLESISVFLHNLSEEDWFHIGE